MHKLEGKYIRELNCVNKVICGRTRKEHYLDNKEHIKQYYDDNKERFKQYYDTNKDKVSERQNQMYNCECGGKYTHVHKLRHFKTILHCQYIESLKTNPEGDEV